MEFYNDKNEDDCRETLRCILSAAYVYDQQIEEINNLKKQLDKWQSGSSKDAPQQQTVMDNNESIDVITNSDLLYMQKYQTKSFLMPEQMTEEDKLRQMQEPAPMHDQEYIPEEKEPETEKDCLNIDDETELTETEAAETKDED